MSTRKPSPRFRAVRPSPEALEGRQLLSATVNGTDLDGDRWSLQLIGPGTMNVSFVTPTGPQALTPADATTPHSIDTITIAGTDSIKSKLIGTVQKAAGGDGRVFFQNLFETGGGQQPPIDLTSPIGQRRPPSVKNGIFSINMPDFWLGNSRGTIPPADTRSGFQLPVGQIPNFAEAGEINVPDGTTTLQFGGVDTTFTPAGGTPLASTNQNNRFNIDLGVPFILGTSIIVNRVVTDSSPAPATPAGSAPTQNTVFFNVAGRLNLFQANEIDGNSAIPGTQFAAHTPPATTTLNPGGTYVVVSDFDQVLTQDRFNGNLQFQETFGQGLTGQIGFVRIGGNASQFTVVVDNNPAEASAGGASVLSSTLSNFSIGGETNNVLVVSGGGERNLFFGKGMDNTILNTDVINSLQANRGALNSTVTVNRGIGAFLVGGDVVNTNVQSGYDQPLEAVGAGVLIGRPVPTIINRQTDNRGTFSPRAQNGGQINAHIAGDVVSSVFSAGVEPNPNFAVANAPGIISQPSSRVFPFGEPDNIIYPHNIINAKVEGKIDNSAIEATDNTNVPTQISVAAGQANQAFFAKTVNLHVGPVVPPNVPEAPFHGTVYHRGQRGVNIVRPLVQVSHPTGPVRTTRALTGGQSGSGNGGSSTPNGQG
jgi:hypothetical protein